MQITSMLRAPLRAPASWARAQLFIILQLAVGVGCDSEAPTARPVHKDPAPQAIEGVNNDPNSEVENTDGGDPEPGPEPGPDLIPDDPAASAVDLSAIDAERLMADCPDVATLLDLDLSASPADAAPVDVQLAGKMQLHPEVLSRTRWQAETTPVRAPCRDDGTDACLQLLQADCAVRCDDDSRCQLEEDRVYYDVLYVAFFRSRLPSGSRWARAQCVKSRWQPATSGATPAQDATDLELSLFCGSDPATASSAAPFRCEQAPTAEPSERPVHPAVRAARACMATALANALNLKMETQP